MVFFEVLERSFKIIIKNLKILLPATLKWFVCSLFIFNILFFWKFFDNRIGIIEGFRDFLSSGDNRILTSILDLKYFLKNYSLGVFLFFFSFITILFVYVGLELFLDLFYTSSVKEYYFGKKVNFNKSLELSWKYFWRYIYTWFFALATMFFSILIAIFLAFLPIISIIVFFTSIFLIIFFLLTLWVLPSVIIFEKKRGLEALKYTFNFAKENFFSLLALLFIIALLQYLVLSSLLYSFLGFVFYLLFSLFFDCWKKSIQAAFYIEKRKFF